MPKELIALAGDLVTERKRLSECLRRLEGGLMPGHAANALYRAYGADAAEAVVAEIDGLARSMDRLGALIKTLVQEANSERLETCEPLLADAALAVEAKGSAAGRPVVVDCRCNEVAIDRETLHRFRPVFLEMLETLVEFCVEPPKERFARKKRPKAYFQIEAKPMTGGCRIMVVCDGNGILPPLAGDHGQRLAEMGVRAAFEGRPGEWSSWRFQVPLGVGPFQGIPIRAGERRLVLPSFAVTSVRRLGAGRAPHGPVYRLGEALSRQLVDSGKEAAHGSVLVEVSAGTRAATFVVDEVLEAQEGFIKQLGEAFNSQGRFNGVVVIETGGEPRGGPREELCLVLNPAYLVYGSPDEGQAAGSPAGAKGKPTTAAETPPPSGKAAQQGEADDGGGDAAATVRRSRTEVVS